MCTKAEKYKYFSQNLIMKWKREDLHKDQQTDFTAYQFCLKKVVQENSSEYLESVVFVLNVLLTEKSYGALLSEADWQLLLPTYVQGLAQHSSEV